MEEDVPTTRCSLCGAEGPREQMFGAPPDLLCEPCATSLRNRLQPSATGRLLSNAVVGSTPATWAVAGIAVLLYVATHVLWKGDAKRFPEWIWHFLPASPTGSISTGQAWRLVTTAFLHGGLLHVLFNVIWIVALGRAVEATRGTLAFLAIFVLSSAFASSLQWYFSKGGIGLSGVLYALAGWLWTRRGVDAVAAALMNPQTSRMLGAWFVICILVPALGVANWAHGGGLAFGLATGWSSTTKRPWIGYLAATAATLAAAWWVSTGHRVGS
jgi:GlpG protein